jgi:hypothetical protein
MGYELQALIGRESALRQFAQALDARIVHLASDVFLLPLTEGVVQNLRTIAGTNADPGAQSIDDLLPLVFDRALEASKQDFLAFIEAYFFGGHGTQFAAAWHKGKLVLGPVSERNVINSVLHLMGVAPLPDSDEFDAVGLGRHRKTERW